MNPSADQFRLVTIWHTYGPYHLARARALEGEFGNKSVICFSHRSSDIVTYPFFDRTPENHQVITEGDANIRFFRATWNTYRLLKKTRPLLVLTCGYERPETLGALIYSRMLRKTIFLMLDNQYDDRKRSRLVEFIKRAYLRLFDGFVYGGDTHRDYLRILKVPLRREVYGYNCVDNDWIEKEANTARSRSERLAPFEKYFLCVARLVAKKNLPALIAAYEMYVKSLSVCDSPWGLVIVGDGPERKELEMQISDRHLEKWVHLAGRVDRFEDVVNYHANAKAVVLASHMDEQWGLVINEAMAAGRPILVSVQCGCATSLVDGGRNGFTFDGRMPEQLTKHMIWMHRNDSELPAMGIRSQEIVKNFSPQQFAQNVRMLYEKGPSR